MHTQSLRHVDPEPPRGLRAAMLRLMATRPAAAAERSLPFRLIVWRLAPRLLRLTGGRLARAFPFPAAVLETRDRRNDRPHRRVVVYFYDAGRAIVVPTRGGGGRNPFWLDNARADPNVRIAGVPHRAELVEDRDELDRLWRLAEAFYPPNATARAHAARQGRTVPLLQLVP